MSRITLLDVEDYQCVRKISIRPGSKNLILIAGMNKVGKSSLIGAITAAFGGKGEEPRRPIRDGAEFADIRIEVDDPILKIYKRFLPSGNSSLRVESESGKLNSPQKILDHLRGTRFLDPLKFMDLSDKDQRITLLKVVDIGIDLDEWEKTKKEYFDNRASANRDVKRHKAALESNPDPGEIKSIESSADLAEKVAVQAEQMQDLLQADAEYKRLRGKAKEKQDAIESLGKSLEKAKKEYEEICKSGHEAKEILDACPNVEKQLAENRVALKAASGQQEEQIKKLAQFERHQAAKHAFESMTKEAAEWDAKLKEWDQEKADKLNAAKMPVDGLTIKEEGLDYNGVPLSQASGSQKLYVSLALAIAMSPNLRDFWIEDGSRLDENGLKEIEAFAVELDVCLWVERVGESDEGALIIEDGAIKV